MRRLRVLVIEDSPADAAFVRAVLDRNEFDIVIATRLAEALDLLAAERFDLTLLDMGLPDGSGLDMLARVREVAAHQPIVILSGDPDERIATAAVQGGAQDYLLKGNVSEVSLRRALRYAVERHELAERLAASVEELERQRASVLQLNQLKNDLIAVLVHDIKGPLTSIVGFAELLEEGYLEGDAGRDAAKTIRTNAQRLATLANDVLALSRIEHGELEIADEQVDVVEVLTGVVETHATDRGITFTKNVEKALVRGDAERLRQVFDNLLRNAIKYSPGGEPVEISLDIDGERYNVAIRDHGMGIPAEDLPRLFERFSRASNARRAKIAGTGIGLFIVKMIVERHGGAIAVQSAVGEGSTFTLSLPTLEAQVSRNAMRATIVTMDAGLSRFAAYELRTRGYRVRECASASDLVQADIRSGDTIIVDAGGITPQGVRSWLRAGITVRLVGIDADASSEWDAQLYKPFLVTDLLKAVAGETAQDLVIERL